eukprot:CAMPEP_0172356118 /NCGR_PEP_ID=MMETSP1060-20121228/452_1 /TAXON_ID=37318 /ORGANISM="Pseudo-nitzschia pungens, Strain cf. cingulata" /LENGTH=154 /DNA_ID=CAMNT_0013076043 /DNA_START=89 /DNA_END=553 /DNA_ORIENTATION=+
MKNQVALVLSATLTTFLAERVESVDHEALKAAAENNPAFRRSLQDKPSFDFFDPEEDTCDNSANPTEDRPILSECDFSRFPVCGDKEDMCYNRKPSRDHFHKDNHQHKFYIQYDRVFCYPLSWGGCSSCTPGRYCKSEKRCILEEAGYPCAEWF